jgi:hypothetical protein
VTGFPYEIKAPNLMKNHGMFEWLEETGLIEYRDWQVVSTATSITGIAFKNKGMAALFKLRFSLS